MKHLVWRAVSAVGIALVVSTGVARSEEEMPSRPSSRSELEAYARQLDGRVVDLQHAIMAARHHGDVDAMERAKKELATVQTKRVETLRDLGELP